MGKNLIEAKSKIYLQRDFNLFFNQKKFLKQKKYLS